MRTASLAGAGLTVPDQQGQTDDRQRHIALIGFGDPTLEAHKSRAIHAAFLCQYGSPYNGRAVWETEMSAGPRAGSPTCTVPPTRLATGERSKQPLLEDSIMAINATPTGEIRPKTTQVINADGSVSSVILVAQATVIKRIRRKLAQRHHRLVITREGTQARKDLGEFAVLDAHEEILTKNADLTNLARFLRVLGDHEMLEAPADKTWRFFGVTEDEGDDGQVTRRRITASYRNERQVRHALAKIPAEGRRFIVGEQVVRHDRLEIEKIQAAIEGNPTLRHLQSAEGCPIKWRAAQDIDKSLQTDPEWAGTNVLERCAEVVRRLDSLGAVDSVEDHANA